MNFDLTQSRCNFLFMRRIIYRLQLSSFWKTISSMKITKRYCFLFQCWYLMQKIMRLSWCTSIKNFFDIIMRRWKFLCKNTRLIVKIEINKLNFFLIFWKFNWRLFESIVIQSIIRQRIDILTIENRFRSRRKM